MQDEITYRILKALEDDPSKSQRELSRELGVSLGKMNYCLKALVDKGWVKAGNFKRSSHKSRYFYLLTPEGVDAKAKVAVKFLRRKMQEYDLLKQQIAELKKETS